MRKACLLLLLVAACSKSETEPTDAGAPDAGPIPATLIDAGIFVKGVGVTNDICTPEICQHNENTDLMRWHGDIYLVHRTAVSQDLGPNSSLHIYKSSDEGTTFNQVATLLAPQDRLPNEEYPDGGAVTLDGGPGVGGGRDLRDPHFFIVNDTLHFIALTRLPVLSTRDSNVDTIAMESHTTDGTHWTPLVQVGPPGWSFWRVKEENGVLYTAAYEDGDSQVTLFSSTDGTTWTKGADVFTDSAKTPLETELTFMPSGRLLALVRTDGDDSQVLGDTQLETQVCWSEPPYDAFHCDAPLQDVRLDGPLSFFDNGRLFVMARKHLGASNKKRTALYEITGNLEGGPLGIAERVVLPSAGDTSYAGGVKLASGDWLFSWYSGDLTLDEPWYLGMFDATDIWLGTMNLGTQ